jgi:hypothetical protein
MSVSFTQEQFNEKALALLKLSEKLNDTWRIEQKEGAMFLIKNDKFTMEGEAAAAAEEEDDMEMDPSSSVQAHGQLISIEYHVLLHPSYQVPTLFFNAYKGS